MLLFKDHEYYNDISSIKKKKNKIERDDQVELISN